MSPFLKTLHVKGQKRVQNRRPESATDDPYANCIFRRQIKRRKFSSSRRESKSGTIVAIRSAVSGNPSPICFSHQFILRRYSIPGATSQNWGRSGDNNYLGAGTRRYARRPTACSDVITRVKNGMILVRDHSWSSRSTLKQQSLSSTTL